jgi:glc operon protein GlcG
MSVRSSGSAIRGLLVPICAATMLGAAAPPPDINRFILPPAAAKQAKVVHEISRDTARRIADACIQYARDHNVAVSVFIVAPSGQIVVADRMDGQGPANIETALMKAKTALYMRDSTHAWMNRMIQNPEFEVRVIPMGQFWNQGGLPIIVNDVLIGAIGIGGSNVDEPCAQAALEQVIGPQPPLAPTLPPRPAQ